VNPGLLFFGVAGYKPKRTIAVVLATLVIVISLPFIAVASMGASALSFLANTPDAKTAESLGFYMGGPVPGNTYAWGNCTYWVYSMRLWAGSPISNYWGNANTWDDYAENDGYLVNDTPAVGAIFQTDEGQYGHVGYVIDVDESTGDWKISEMNAPVFNVISHRTFSSESASFYKFIHSKIGAPEWTPSDISIPSHGIGS